jgi:hypothetical protein
MRGNTTTGRIDMELRRQIGIYSMICGRPNKYLHLKNTASHHWFESEERIYQGSLEEFQRLTTIFFKRFGKITVGEISEMEKEAIAHARSLV